MVRTLVVGSTGEIGLPLTLALIKEGHAVFALVRSSSRGTKAAIMSRLENAGVQLVEGDLGNAESVQRVFQQLHPVEAVVCAVAGEQLMNQQHLITASVQAGTVTRFLPSEFSYDLSSPAATTPELFEPKRKIQKQLQDAKLSYTIVSSNGFMEHWYPGLGVLGQSYPPDPVLVFGDGNGKGLANAIEDIVTYAAKALSDTRTENKRLIICPEANKASQNDLIVLWERISGMKVSRNTMTAEELDKQMQVGTLSLRTSDNYSNATFLKLIKGFWLDGEAVQPLPPDGVEAAALYPEVKITAVESYYTKLFQVHTGT